MSDTRTILDVQREQAELQSKLNRLVEERDQCRTKSDAGSAERAANLKVALERGAEKLSELVLEGRDLVSDGYRSGRGGAEHGDGGEDVDAPVHTKSAARPWLPGIGEYRKLRTKAVGTGGAFIPAAYHGSFFDLLRKRTAVLAAGPLTIPVVGAGLVRVPRVTSSVTIAGVPENTAITPADPGLGDLVLDPKKFGAMTLVAREAVEDSAPQLRGVVAETLTRDLAVELDRQLVVGDGAGNNLRGLLNTTGSTAGPSTGVNGASPTFAMLADTMTALENANADPERAAWIMHSRSWGSIRKLIDSSGQPIVTPDPTAGTPRSLFGRPVFISNSLPINTTVGTSTDTSSIILADMSQVVVAVARDIEVLYSEDYAFNADQVAIKATCRYDVGVINPAAVVTVVGVRP